MDSRPLAGAVRAVAAGGGGSVAMTAGGAAWVWGAGGVEDLGGGKGAAAVRELRAPGAAAVTVAVAAVGAGVGVAVTVCRMPESESRRQKGGTPQWAGDGGRVTATGGRRGSSGIVSPAGGPESLNSRPSHGRDSEAEASGGRRSSGRQSRSGRQHRDHTCH
jgi:hypothetical protein